MIIERFLIYDESLLGGKPAEESASLEELSGHILYYYNCNDSAAQDDDNDNDKTSARDGHRKLLWEEGTERSLYRLRARRERRLERQRERERRAHDEYDDEDEEWDDCVHEEEEEVGRRGKRDKDDSPLLSWSLHLAREEVIQFAGLCSALQGLATFCHSCSSGPMVREAEEEDQGKKENIPPTPPLVRQVHLTHSTLVYVPLEESDSHCSGAATLLAVAEIPRQLDGSGADPLAVCRMLQDFHVHRYQLFAKGSIRRRFASFDAAHVFSHLFGGGKDLNSVLSSSSSSSSYNKTKKKTKEDESFSLSFPGMRTLQDVRKRLRQTRTALERHQGQSSSSSVRKRQVAQWRRDVGLLQDVLSDLLAVLPLEYVRRDVGFHYDAFWKRQWEATNTTTHKNGGNLVVGMPHGRCIVDLVPANTATPPRLVLLQPPQVAAESSADNEDHHNDAALAVVEALSTFDSGRLVSIHHRVHDRPRIVVSREAALAIRRHMHEEFHLAQEQEEERQRRRRRLQQVATNSKPPKGSLGQFLWGRGFRNKSADEEEEGGEEEEEEEAEERKKSAAPRGKLDASSPSQDDTGAIEGSFWMVPPSKQQQEAVSTDEHEATQEKTTQGTIWTPKVYLPAESTQQGSCGTERVVPTRVALYQHGQVECLTFVPTEDDDQGEGDDEVPQAAWLKSVRQDLQKLQQGNQDAAKESGSAGSQTFQPAWKEKGIHAVFVDRSQGTALIGTDGVNDDDDDNVKDKSSRPETTFWPPLDQGRYQLASSLSLEILRALDDVFSELGDQGGELCTFLSQAWVYGWKKGPHEVYLVLDPVLHVTMAHVQKVARQMCQHVVPLNDEKVNDKR